MEQGTEANLNENSPSIEVPGDTLKSEEVPDQFEKIVEDFKALDLEIPELENYEDWCGISDEFLKLINDVPNEDQKFLFKNDDDESEDDDDEEHQVDLCKKYRKFIRELFN